MKNTLRSYLFSYIFFFLLAASSISALSLQVEAPSEVCGCSEQSANVKIINPSNISETVFLEANVQGYFSGNYLTVLPSGSRDVSFYFQAPCTPSRSTMILGIGANTEKEGIFSSNAIKVNSCNSISLKGQGKVLGVAGTQVQEYFTLNNYGNHDVTVTLSSNCSEVTLPNQVSAAENHENSFTASFYSANELSEECLIEATASNGATASQEVQLNFYSTTLPTTPITTATTQTRITTTTSTTTTLATASQQAVSSMTASLSSQQYLGFDKKSNTTRIKMVFSLFYSEDNKTRLLDIQSKTSGIRVISTQFNPASVDGKKGDKVNEEAVVVLAPAMNESEVKFSGVMEAYNDNVLTEYLFNYPVSPNLFTGLFTLGGAVGAFLLALVIALLLVYYVGERENKQEKKPKPPLKEQLQEIM